MRKTPAKRNFSPQMMKTEIFADTFRYRVWSEGRQCAGTACGVRERLTACGVRERLAECGNGSRSAGTACGVRERLAECGNGSRSAGTACGEIVNQNLRKWEKRGRK
ncbi:MAG: hypothetical protein E7029_07750 [Planctomycetaceae bacterium]|nr:hypothetical protein [Planctomycetaceae bacterium]